jgi:5-(carboxyamino)imidazole ribonucleotide synthase
MGLRCLSIDPGSDTPAGQIAASQVGSLRNLDDLTSIFQSCDFVTLENEFVPADIVEAAMANADFNPDHLTPGTHCLRTIQDKLLQRQAYQIHGAPTPKAVPIHEAESLGLPVVLKARFGGYDGKGTRYARTSEELAAIQTEVNPDEWLAEEFVPFKRELAVMVYRSKVQTGTFPTVETRQTNHVCDLVLPTSVSAKETAIHAVEAVGGFGLFGVELFEHQDGSFSINEIAPRPHNTGHYTLDWGGVSQFEQHVRLAMHLPTVEPTGRPTVMANLLGQPGQVNIQAGLRALLDLNANARFHWYGKSEIKPGRKMGHLNIPAEGAETVDYLVEQAIHARQTFYQASCP